VLVPDTIVGVGFGVDVGKGFGVDIGVAAGGIVAAVGEDVGVADVGVVDVVVVDVGVVDVVVVDGIVGVAADGGLGMVAGIAASSVTVLQMTTFFSLQGFVTQECILTTDQRSHQLDALCVRSEWKGFFHQENAFQELKPLVVSLPLSRLTSTETCEGFAIALCRRACEVHIAYSFDCWNPNPTLRPQ